MYRYVPVGILEKPPQRMNERIPKYNGRGDLGMISHEMSLITIFGHKHKIKNFIKKLDIFHKKIFNSLRFWLIFGIKLRILNQNCNKID